MSLTVASKIISVLGNPSALTPVVVKDGIQSLSLTGFAYKAGGEVEAKEKFIDEFGTAVIWLGGIPLCKKLLPINGSTMFDP